MQRAAILAPFGNIPFFDGGGDAYQALTNEHYVIWGRGNTSLSDHPAVTLNEFVNKANQYNGVLVYFGHGTPDAIGIEIYQTSKARRTAYLNYLAHGWTRDEIKPMNNPDFLNPFNGGEDYGIYITGQGIRDRWHGNNAIVYLGACLAGGGPIADAFRAAGARTVYGYSKPLFMPYGRIDSARFWTSLDGTCCPDAALGSTKTRTTMNAFADCQAQGSCTNGVLNQAGPSTLAPSVISRSPDPKGTPIIPPVGVTASVTFDTAMDTSIDPTTVLQADGCGVSASGSSKNDQPKWSDDGTSVKGTFQVKTAGTLTIRVMAAHAVSKNNGAQLDGNTNPNNGTKDASMGPNQDDFTWKVKCGLDGYKAGPVTLQYTDGTSQTTETWTFDICRSLTFGRPYWNEYLHSHQVTGGQASDYSGEVGAVPYPGGGPSADDSPGTRSVTFDMAAHTVTMTMTAKPGYSPSAQTATGPIQPWPNCTSG